MAGLAYLPIFVVGQAVNRTSDDMIMHERKSDESRTKQGQVREREMDHPDNEDTDDDSIIFSFVQSVVEVCKKFEKA